MTCNKFGQHRVTPVSGVFGATSRRWRHAVFAGVACCGLVSAGLAHANPVIAGFTDCRRVPDGRAVCAIAGTGRLMVVPEGLFEAYQNAVEREPVAQVPPPEVRPVAPPSADPESASYQQGLADRTNWEQWFAALTGDYQHGALYWAEHRSKSRPGSCHRHDAPDDDWIKGCLAAHLRLVHVQVGGYTRSMESGAIAASTSLMNSRILRPFLSSRAPKREPRSCNGVTP